jgi:hypothetical protein
MSGSPWEVDGTHADGNEYLHLRDSVEFGTRFGDWQVCWIGGWARFRLYFLVMLVKVPLPEFSPRLRRSADRRGDLSGEEYDNRRRSMTFDSLTARMERAEDRKIGGGRL